MIEISRNTYDIYEAFPQVPDFPNYDNPDPNLAVLVRLFSMGGYTPISHKYVYMALWSMRSHMLNSDMRQYRPTIIFHIESRLYLTARPIFEKAGIPMDSIVVFPTTMIPTTIKGNILHHAASPFVDPQLDRFERVIVLDADSFSLGNDYTGLVPLMDISLNHMPPDKIALLRGWARWEPVRDEYQNWYDHGMVGKEGWIKKAADYCGQLPEVVENILYPDKPLENARPYHNGAYISLPMRFLRDNPEFRSFIHEVSGTMGNEEIAMAVWYIKHYIETGERLPDMNLQDYIFEHGRIHLDWDLDSAWERFQSGTPCFVHLYTYNQIADYIHDWTKAVHASEHDGHQFATTVVNDVRKMKEEANDEL